MSLMLKSQPDLSMMGWPDWVIGIWRPVPLEGSFKPTAEFPIQKGWGEAHIFEQTQMMLMRLAHS